MIETIKSKSDLCKGCNRCIRECPMETANITFQDEDSNIKVRIDHEKCIACGRCITACRHDARYYEDDTKRFFEDLLSGVPISLISASSIPTSIPEYKRLFTYLKQLGVRKIYDVSLGGDICAWAHVKFIEGALSDSADKPGSKPFITQRCPAIVRYCEIYCHDLLKRLSPIQSPTACASVYMKEYQGIDDSIAVLSPCIARTNEFETTGLAQYSLTFYKLLEYLWENNITLPDEDTQFDHDENGLGLLFPTQGGLRKNIEYAIPRKLHITKDNGFGIYDKLDKYAQSPEEFLPDVYDALNCNEGCVSGAACVQDQNIFELDKAKYISNSSKSKSAVTPQREDYDSAFKKYDTTLDPAHFIREYKPVDVAFPQITDKDIEKAYELLGSPDYRKQGIDCSACGSETCYEMARKIALEVNIPGNCMIKAMDDARTEHINYVIAHEQLLEAIDVAKEASRAKTDFLASMSHEIRTPMNAIIGMAELLEHEPLNSRQKGFVHDIGASAHSLLGIINDILDMSKIESGKLELNPVDYCLGSLTDNIASMFTYVANDKGLEFKVETDTDLPYCLYGDDIRLKQILTNICGNAVKFTEKGYIKLAITANNGKLTFKVEDTGMGIRTEDLPKLFKVFEQVDKYKNRNVVGTGLGLSISRSFAKMMGGEITVESKYGQGTTFTITIPIVPGNAENILKKDIDEGEQFLSAPDAKILVTDDNEFNLKVACGLLGLIDIEADTAESGAKAIELVKKNDYDIVFMDQMMPEMDGIEALREIRKLGGKYENLAVVALTANAVKSAREMLLDCGFNDFLAKPIDTAKLHDVIKKYLPPDKLQKNTDLGKPEDRGKKMDDLHRKAIVTFVKENRNTYKDIEDSLNSGDIKTAHRIAHTLKSSAGYLGKKALQEAALSLEMSLQAVPTRTDKQPLLYTEDQLDALRSELEQAIREFEPVFLEAEAEKPSAVQVDSEKLDAVLSGLEPLLRKGDFGAVDFVEELQGIAGMEELAEKIDDYDFEGALVLLEKIMKDGAQ